MVHTVRTFSFRIRKPLPFSYSLLRRFNASCTMYVSEGVFIESAEITVCTCAASCVCVTIAGESKAHKCSDCSSNVNWFDASDDGVRRRQADCKFFGSSFFVGLCVIAIKIPDKNSVRRRRKTQRRSHHKFSLRRGHTKYATELPPVAPRSKRKHTKSMNCKRLKCTVQQPVEKHRPKWKIRFETWQSQWPMQSHIRRRVRATKDSCNLRVEDSMRNTTRNRKRQKDHVVKSQQQHTANELCIDTLLVRISGLKQQKNKME